MTTDYQDRISQQIDQYADLGALWPLPPITGYWMRTHISPRLKDVFGTPNVFDLYFDEIQKAASRRERLGQRALVCSVGAGDCNIEIRLSERLAKTGISNVTFIATELSPKRLDRARKIIEAMGLTSYFEFLVVDLNEFSFDREVDIFIAHHTLHHIVNLEGLFSEIFTSMSSEGCLLTSDMIGRNGHQRWPEALDWVNRMWAFVPDHIKFNYQFNQTHKEFLNWDCSRTGFEGIRAQDILPLMVERFHFSGFVGFGGMIDPFIERGYGRNLWEKSVRDRAFVDFLEELNQMLLETGRIKPTMMIACARKADIAERYFRNLSPRFCIRPPDAERVEPLIEVQP